MAFFAELLDTGRDELAELQAAKTILMLGALKSEPCELATVHAMNSRLLLDECTSPAFYELVIKQRIRFRWLEGDGGEPWSPRQEFGRRLGTEMYFGAWPETRATDGSGGFVNHADVCDLVRRIVVDDDPTSTGIPTLDVRIAAARELFAAIEQSGYRKLEVRRREKFVSSLQLVVNDVPRAEEYARLRQVVGDLVAQRTIDSRSAAYHAIETQDLGPILKAQAKDVVDAVYNRSVAYSLESEFLSTRRMVPLGNSFHAATRSSRAWIEHTSRIDADERLKPLAGRGITWENVRNAVTTQLQPLSEYGSTGARDALAKELASTKWLTGSMPVVTASVGAAVGGYAPAAVAAVGLGGALAGWAAVPLAILGAGAFVLFDKAASKYVEERKASQIRRELDGWLDTPD